MTWSAFRCCCTAGYYPSAIMYIVYGVFCVVGFMSWLRIERRERTDAVADGVADSGGRNRRLSVSPTRQHLRPCSSRSTHVCRMSMAQRHYRLDGRDRPPKTFDSLFAELTAKVADRDPRSTTVARVEAGVHEIGKKIVEEAAEVWMAAEYQSKDQAAAEISQLLYHLQVMMLALDLDLEDVYATLTPLAESQPALLPGDSPHLG